MELIDWQTSGLYIQVLISFTILINIVMVWCNRMRNSDVLYGNSYWKGDICVKVRVKVKVPLSRGIAGGTFDFRRRVV